MLHPSTEELTQFATGMASRGESRSIVAHLLSGCISCKVTVESILRPRREGISLFRLLFRDFEEQPFSLTTAGSINPDIDPRELLRQLETYPVAHQQILALNSERFLSPRLVILLLEDSRAHRYLESTVMLRSARLAKAIADRLPAPSPAAEKRLWDLRALCYGQLSQALRRSDELTAAEEALSTARAFLLRGTGEPLPAGVVNEYFGSLRIAQLRYQEAAQSYSSAAGIYRQVRCADFVGRALVGQAIAQCEGGLPQQALDSLSEAMPKLTGDATLTLAACQAFVRSLIDLGKINEASYRWIELRTLHAHFKEPIIQLKAAWLEGLLLKGQGRDAAALKLLRATRRGFRERGAAKEAAHVSLDMAGCYSRLGLAGESRQALAEIMVLEQDYGLQREAILETISIRAAECGPADKIARLAP